MPGIVYQRTTSKIRLTDAKYTGVTPGRVKLKYRYGSNIGEYGFTSDQTASEYSPAFKVNGSTLFIAQKISSTMSTTGSTSRSRTAYPGDDWKRLTSEGATYSSSQTQAYTITGQTATAVTMSGYSYASYTSAWGRNSTNTTRFHSTGTYVATLDGGDITAANYRNVTDQYYALTTRITSSTLGATFPRLSASGSTYSQVTRKGSIINFDAKTSAGKSTLNSTVNYSLTFYESLYAKKATQHGYNFQTSRTLYMRYISSITSFTLQGARTYGYSYGYGNQYTYYESLTTTSGSTISSNNCNV